MIDQSIVDTGNFSIIDTVVPLFLATLIQRPPSLIWPQFFAAVPIMHLLPLPKGHLSNVATMSWQIG